jgi:hypothetical protein
LQFPREVVGEQPGPQIRLIAVERTHGHIIEVAMGLAFGEDPFRRAASLREGRYPLGLQGLVGNVASVGVVPSSA